MLGVLAYTAKQDTYRPHPTVRGGGGANCMMNKSAIFPSRCVRANDAFVVCASTDFGN